MRKPAPKKSVRTRAPIVTPSTPPTDPTVRLDAALVEELAAIVARHDLSEVKIDHNGLSIRVSRQLGVLPAAYAAPAQSPAAPVASAPTLAPTAVAATPADHPGLVKSPMVGTAYRRPSPDAQPFIEVGQPVKAGERVMLVEAMKTFNEIVANRAGVVTAIFVEDGQPVEYGEPLLAIE